MITKFFSTLSQLVHNLHISSGSSSQVARNTLCVSVFCVDGFNLFHLDSFLGSVNYAPPKGGELVKLQRVSTKEAYIRLAG